MKRRLMMPFAMPCIPSHTWFSIKMLFEIDQLKIAKWEAMATNAYPMIQALNWLNENEFMYHVEIEDADRNGEPAFRYALVMDDMDAAILRLHQPELIIGSLCNE